MAITRREFIEGAAAIGGATMLAGTASAAAASRLAAQVPPEGAELPGEVGSPYFLSSHAPEGLLGEGGYERLREEVIHFGMTPEDRDRYLWGL